MAVTVNVYNHTASLLVGGLAPFSDIAVQLCSALTFNPADTDVGAMTYTELPTANGYITGGYYIASGTVVPEIVNGVDGKLSAGDAVWTASGSGLSATHALVMVYSSFAGTAPLFALDFGGTITASAGNDFRVVWDPVDGIMRINKV